MKRKTKYILVITLSVISLCLLLVWGIVNFLVIPKIVIPKVEHYIYKNIKAPAEVSIDGIHFSLIKGFMLKDITLSGPVELNDRYIFHAKTVDIDFALMPLLWKRIEIIRFEMSGVDLNIGRNSEGKWNFSDLRDFDVMKESDIGEDKTEGNYKFVVKKVIIDDCYIDYSDYHKKDNVLERRYRNIKLVITNPRRKIYKIKLYGAADNKKSESINLNLDYDMTKHTGDGVFIANTKCLGEYWDYYLDDIFHPWHLKADNIKMQLKFTSIGNKLLIDGNYTIDNGILGYGDLNIGANADIKQTIECINGKFDTDKVYIEVDLEDMIALSGEKVFFEGGKTSAVITNKEIHLERVHGLFGGTHGSFQGKFSFLDPMHLNLNGRIGEIYNQIQIHILSKDHAQVDFESTMGDSYVRLKADIEDIKNLSYTSDVEVSLNMLDVCEFLDVDKEDLKGMIYINGEVKGEVDNDSSPEGKLNLVIKDFSVIGLKPETLEAEITVKNGLFESDIPRTEFYNGVFYGHILTDFDRVGLEMHIKNLDIESLVANKPEYKGAKGIFTLNFACVSKWADLPGVEGGGYFKFNNCNLWNVPVFRSVKEGIEESAEEEMDMPVIGLLEGNFEIWNKGIDIPNIFCRAKNISLQMQGRLGFNEEVNMTVGVSFSQGSLLRAARQVVLPVTIGFDLYANSFKVNVYGNVSDLKHKVGIKPTGWLNAFFPSVSGAKVNKYTLKELWDIGLEEKRKKDKLAKQERRKKRIGKQR